jgi:hypothetical protein
MVSTSRSRIIGEEKVDKIAREGPREEGDFKGKVYKKQKTFEPSPYLS